MVIFIDESGIHKKVGHSSFAIVFVEVVNIETFSKKLLEINKLLKIKSFHWSEQRLNVRRKYLKSVLNLDFIFKIAIFENPINTNKAMDMIFEHLITEKKVTLIAIDGKKPKWYEHKLKKELRDKGITVKKLKTVRNEISEPGIQLADALAGLAIYCFENNNSDYMNLLRKFKRNQKLLVQMIF